MDAKSIWKFAWLCAVSDGVPRHSFYVAIVVGEGKAAMQGRGRSSP